MAKKTKRESIIGQVNSFLGGETYYTKQWAKEDTLENRRAVQDNLASIAGFLLRFRSEIAWLPRPRQKAAQSFSVVSSAA